MVPIREIELNHERAWSSVKVTIKLDFPLVRHRVLVFGKISHRALMMRDDWQRLADGRGAIDSEECCNPLRNDDDRPIMWTITASATETMSSWTLTTENVAQKFFACDSPRLLLHSLDLGWHSDSASPSTCVTCAVRRSWTGPRSASASTAAIGRTP